VAGQAIPEVLGAPSGLVEGTVIVWMVVAILAIIMIVSIVINLDDAYETIEYWEDVDFDE